MAVAIATPSSMWCTLSSHVHFLHSTTIVTTALLLLLAVVTTTNAQDSFLDSPSRIWEQSSDVPPMGEGNGIVVAPNGRTVYATSSDGTISSLDPDSGNVEWSYQPPSTSSSTAPLSSNSQVYIANNANFLVYSVTESQDSDNAMCKVVALGNPAGDLLWVSPDLEGICSGTPVISGDGKLVFLTHNSGGTLGHFTILSAEQKGIVLFSRFNTVAPYAPPGIIWNPTRGNFDDGFDNRDVIVWSYMPGPDADGVGPGRTFAFQLSRTFNNDTSDFDVNVLLPEVDWQSTTAPLIVRNGEAMYWSVSRSKLRAWVQEGTNSSTGQFDQGRTADADFDRGDPSWLAGFTTPQADDEDNPDVVCVAGASEDFYCLEATTLVERWKKTTGSLIKTEARFSTTGSRVYFVEEDGTMHSITVQEGRTNWEQRVSNNVVSNFDLSEDGGVLYVGDETGRVEAWQLSSTTPPPVTPATREPSAAPSMAGPTDPTAPTRPPDGRPTPRPTEQPTSAGTTSNVLTVVSMWRLASGSAGVALALMFL